jgi:hypothetical protein
MKYTIIFLACLFVGERIYTHNLITNYVEEAVIEINRDTPVKYTPELRLDRVIPDGVTLVFNFTILNGQYIDSAAFISRVCSDSQGFSKQIEVGLNLRADFFDPDGLRDTVIITKKICNEL